MIGLFNDCFPPIMDGVSLTTQNYAYWLNRKTGNICVITPKCPKANDDGGYPVYRYSSVPIPIRKPYRLGFPWVDLSFQEQISKLSFELVHAHCPFSSGNLAMRIAKKRNIPMVATFHSKYRADLERAIPNKMVIDYLIKHIIKFYEQADEVWVPQPAVEETLREYGYKGKIEVVDNGSDFACKDSTSQLQEEARRKLDIGSLEFVLLFVGQHIWEKNLRFLLEALALVKDIPYRMYFVGSGYAANEMRRIAEKSDLLSRVNFVGTITNRHQLKNYYAAANLFLFPSLYDNAPLVVREAAAVGTPSLLIQGSTCSEIIEDSYNGFLAENSVNSFADKIRELYVSLPVVCKVGKNASRTVARSWKDITDEVYDRYINLIRRKNV